LIQRRYGSKVKGVNLSHILIRENEMKNRMLCPVMLLVGVGIGAGVGMLISKPKIDEQKKKNDQLVTQMEIAKTDSEAIIEGVETEITQNKNELTRTRSMLNLITTQLAKANAEITALKSPDPQSPVTLSETTKPVVVITTPRRTDRTASTAGATDYTIKDGDSFWKIAQEQLGDGNRYKEILELNPSISENQTLVIGTKIKIPTR
jgi:nucleoid-associated protein YgaU